MKMNKVLYLFFFPVVLLSQSIYNPQQMYDHPGGLFDEDSIRQIHLEFYDPNFHPYLVNSWYYSPSERIPAKLTLNGIVYDSVGVRYKGNSTFCLPNDNFVPKVPYNIDMNYFISGQKLLGYKKMKLANAWMDPTFMKQIVSSNAYKNYLPTGESNLVQLFVQGNYLGLYINDESINKQFLMKHFDEKSGPLFKCDNIDRFCDTANAPSAMPPNLFYMGEDSSLYYDSYDMKSDHGWKELVNLIRTIDQNFNEIDSVLNVDRTLWAFAINQVMLNLDCYNTYYIHNYYLYQTEDGLFQMIPWDLDNSFVGAIMGWDYWNPNNVYHYDPYYMGPSLSNSQPWEVRPLLYKLLDHPLYKDIYTAHIRTIMSEMMDTSVIRFHINSLQNQAYFAANNDNNKAFSMNDYFNNVESAIWTGWGFGGIISSIDARKQYLMNHPEIMKSPPIISSVIANNNIIEADVFDASLVEFMVTSSEYNSKFKSYVMNDNGLNGDLLANDGVYTSTIPNLGSGDVKFYIRARNEEALVLSPQRAEYEFYEYSISTNTLTSVSDEKKLIGTYDVLGRKSKITSNQPMLFIYDDGSVDRRLFITR